MLRIQDSNYSNSHTLLEALGQCSEKALFGYGAFAFCTVNGIKLLFNDPAFRHFLTTGSYLLIIGVDSITNEASLELLNKLETDYKGLDVKVYITSKSDRSIFHPKFTFFGYDDGNGSIVAGSGNLTSGGLLFNREAYGLNILNRDELKSTIDDWSQWLDETKTFLKPVLDDEAIERARENKTMRSRTKKTTGKSDPEGEEDETEEENEDTTIGAQDDTDEDKDQWIAGPKSEVLIAEIPRSGNRWKQANFSQDVVKDYFGITPGDTGKRVVLRSIDKSGKLSSPEVRPAVLVKSRNFRFELDAASDLDYPTSGRPIGIFLKVAPRTFTYYLSMPGDADHQEFADWINSERTLPAARMFRAVSTVEDCGRIFERDYFKPNIGS